MLPIYHVGGLLFTMTAVPHPSDAHVFTGRCALFCGGAGARAGLLTLTGDQWAAPIKATNGRRDTIEICAPCWIAWRGDARTGWTPGAVFRPLPSGPAGQSRGGAA